MTDTTLEWGLKRLGLKQEYKREFNVQASFGLSFVIMSPIVGLSSGFTYGWEVGGPGPASWGWAVASIMTLCTGLSLAEILSGMPVSGGPFFWTALLGGRHSALLSWITGWCNLFGLTALAAASALATLWNVAAAVQILSGVTLSAWQQLLILQGVIVIGGAVNSSSPTRLTRCMFYGAFLNVVGVIFLVLLLPTVGPWRQSPKFVFGTFLDKSLSPFVVPSNAYLWIQGVGIALFTLAGFDSCSHLSEEMKGANSSAPRAMIWSIIASSSIGGVLLLAVLFCIQSPDNLMYSSATSGYALGQMLFDVFNARFGTGIGAVSALSVCILAGIMTTIACITSTSRMMLTISRNTFEPGPIHLGRWSNTIGWISIAWIILTMCLLAFPSSLPVTLDEVQFPLIFGLGGSLAAWFLPKWGARHFYIDPKQQAALATSPLLDHGRSG
ncbi:hypothetical protein WJX73_008888 [Symbiochloris irregularis]|uniref:Amino acid permease n=1 Tax=Symbiochloris irregularis TaxID=706552 RepID=A0AAW1PZ14_9CHLO